MIFVCRRNGSFQGVKPPIREVTCKKHLLSIKPILTDSIVKTGDKYGTDTDCLYCLNKFKAYTEIVIADRDKGILTADMYADILEECKAGKEDSAGQCTKELQTA